MSSKSLLRVGQWNLWERISRLPISLPAPVFSSFGKISSKVFLLLLYAFSSGDLIGVEGPGMTKERLPKTWLCIRLSGKGKKILSFYTAQLNSPGQKTREGFKAKSSGKGLNILELAPTHNWGWLNKAQVSRGQGSLGYHQREVQLQAAKMHAASSQVFLASEREIE